MLPALESSDTAPLDSVTALKVIPSKPDQLSPSKVTLPDKEVAVSPFESVTLSSNLKLVAAPAVSPELAVSVDWNRTRPVAALLTVRDAPVPSPRFETAPVKVVVPAPIPAASVKS